MKIYVGTSGWMYKHWNEKFFPKEIKGTAMLSYFAKFFKTVEINSSFYRIPGDQAFKTWYQNTPENFLFSVKLNRQFTHRKKLILDDETISALELFIRRTAHLKKKFGALLVQLPPSLTYNYERLEFFLNSLKRLLSRRKNKPDIAIEFRHASWFQEEIFELLKRQNISFVVGNSTRYPWHQTFTNSVGYLRLHGPTRLFASKYTNKQLQEWKRFILKQKQLKRVYVYFNNDFEAYAIENATYLSRIIKSRKKSKN